MIDELYRLAMDLLEDRLEELGAAATDEDGDLVVHGHRLGLSVTFEGFSRQAGRAIAPVDLQIHLDGDQGDRFRVGTLGIGATEEAAARAAVEEWFVLAASPVLDALCPPRDEGGKRPQQLAGWDCLPGRIGIRGQVPAELAAGSDFYRRVLGAIRKIVLGWKIPSRGELRSVFITAACEEGPCEVQAAVDGFVNEELTGTLANLPWPHGAAYLYKQLFVLRRGISN
jgi:hypothetical protein